MSSMDHPFIEAGDDRVIAWGYLPLKTSYEFELINFGKANTTSYGNGGYVNTVALVLKSDCKGLQVGDYIAIGLPYHAFVTAVKELPVTMRRPVMLEKLGDDNVYLKFTKLSMKRMRIHNMERKQITESMKLRADDIKRHNYMFFMGDSK